MKLLAELQRRNVLRAGVLYAGAVWALAQGISQLSPAIGLPDWATRWFLVAAAIGFPFAMFFSWFFEWTPQGLKRESEIATDASIVRSTGRKLDRAISAVLAIAVVLLLTNTFVWHKGAGLHEEPVSTITAKSIAVLPFVNMSGDPKNDYFSDGITEEILNALAQVPNLKVAARTSAFTFKGREGDLRKIADTLDVATVLEGSVQKFGDAVRITAQLVDTRSGFQLWSEKYDRKLDNIFAVEDEISRAITDRLRLQWSAAADQPQKARHAIDPHAHDFYLRGLPLVAARGPGLREAAADFQQAVAIDPDYAQAWAALAETQILLPHYFLESQETAFPVGEAAAKRALALDPNTAAAYVALAMMYRIQWKWRDADTAFQRAMKISPGDAEAVDQYGQFLLAEGRLDEALTQIGRAQRLDPLSGVIAATRVNVLTGLHRFDDAEAQARDMLSERPDFALGQFVAADVAIYRRDYALAKSRFQAGAGLIGEAPDVYMALVDGVAEPGQRAAAIRVVLAASGDTHQRLTEPARIKWLMLLGDHGDALDALQRIGHDVMFGQDNVWQPAFDPVRGDLRFKAALDRMGLPYTPGN
jgi:TolB-like protein/Tfp pilus assembly protein PilF